jgi:hypothetical protein
MNATTIAVVSAFAVMALAGCTGSFDIDQTEPFRVQLDGAPQTVVVREGAEPQEVNIQTCPDTADPCDVDEVDVKVKVEKTSTEACSIKVIVKTTSGEVLGEKVIDVGGAVSGSSSGSMTNGTNATGNETSDDASVDTSGGDIIIQNLVVNIKGNKNIIVVTQALQGVANVDIQAIQASGNADVDADQDTSATTTATMTATTSPTNSTSGNTTTPPY